LLQEIRKPNDVFPAPDDTAVRHSQRHVERIDPGRGPLSDKVTSVTLVLWGSIDSAALVEAYDKGGIVVAKASRDKVPERSGPEQPIPSLELTVKAPAIAYVRFSSAPPGGYLVCDEVRFSPP
jgi:hypothetical protein